MSKNDFDLSRLPSVVNYARQAMQFFREERNRVVRRLAGNRYSATTSKKPTYVNLISLYTSIISRTLISNNPRCLLTTFNKQHQPTLDAMQSWLNKEIERVDMASTIRRVVVDSLISIGICKTGLATPADHETHISGIDVGLPFLSAIDLDDFVFDVHAKSFDQVEFIGHRYRVPISVIRDSKLYDKRQRENLAVTDDKDYNEQGDQRIGMIGRGSQGFDEELEDKVDLWEIFHPRSRCVYTMTANQVMASDRRNSFKPFREQDYIGPDMGPYTILSHGTIPGNPFPKGPIQDVIDIDEAANQVYRKLVRQAFDYKKIVVARDGADVEQINKTNDGSGCKVSQPDSVMEKEFGGVNQGLFLFMKELIQRFSWLAGNLETIGGLAPQANTLGQEELLAKQSNAQVAGMQDTTVKFTTTVFRNLLWYHWYHPTAVQKTRYEMPGMPEISVNRELHPWNAPPQPGEGMGRSVHRRIAMLDEIEAKIDPYSMQHQTPQQKAAMLQQIVTGIYVPMAGVAQQQGITFNFQEFLEILGRYTDLPELNRVLSLGEPPGEETTETGGGMPAETTRNYVRKSAGGNSQANRDMEMGNALSSGSDNMSGQLQSL